MAMTLRLSAEDQALFAEEARIEGISVQQLVVRNTRAAILAARRNRRLDEIIADLGRKSAELDSRLA